MNSLKILLKGVAFTILLTLVSVSVTAASETVFSGGGIIRAGVETGNARDALRLILFAPTGGEAWYDTALDYPREQSWRTLLDGGNITVHFEHVSIIENVTAPVMTEEE